MSWYSLRPLTRIAHVVAIVVVAALIASACGGGSSETSAGDDETTESSEVTETEAERDETEPTATDVAIPTSTSLPTSTPLPTSTAEPLEAPTPSTVLLTTAFTNSSKVTTVGIDEVFFGMTAEDAAEAASTEWVELPSGSANCYRVTPANGPDRVELWVVDGHVERIDIEHPDLRTPSKLGVGNTSAELRSQLGDRLTIEAGGDGGQVATFTPTDAGDRDFRIVFELFDDQVVRYRSGRVGIIDRAAAGC